MRRQRQDEMTPTPKRKSLRAKSEKAIVDQLHLHMDAAIEERIQRIELSQLQKDTDRQWDLIAAVVEEAIIKDLNLEGRQATRMHGRSKVSYRDEDETSYEE